jgi:hypothetical protein
MANQHLQNIYGPDSSACGRSFDRLSQVVLENIKVLNVKWQQKMDTKLSEKQTKKHLGPVS